MNLLYAKDQYEAKHMLLINKREGIGLYNCDDCKTFIKYPNHIDDIY